MRDAEAEIKERNRVYFPLKMIFERIRDSKRIISFILNTPMERPIFSLAYSCYCFRRQICTPLLICFIERDCTTRLINQKRSWLKLYYGSMMIAEQDMYYAMTEQTTRT